MAAPYASLPGFGNAGYIRVYDPSGNFINITSPNAEYGSHFGDSVAVYAFGETSARVVASAPGETVDGEGRAGRVYPLQIGDTAAGPIVSSWYELKRPGGSVENSNFGEVVATFGSDVLVGAPYDDPDGVQNAGQVYVFSYQGGTSWNSYTLSSQNKVLAGWFGYSIAIASEGHFLIGAPF